MICNRIHLPRVRLATRKGEARFAVGKPTESHRLHPVPPRHADWRSPADAALNQAADGRKPAARPAANAISA